MRDLRTHRRLEACSVLLLTNPRHDLEILAAELRDLGHEAATMDRVQCAPFIRQVVCDVIVVALDGEADARALAALQLAHPAPRYLALAGSTGAALAALRTRTPYLPLGVRADELSRALRLVEPTRSVARTSLPAKPPIH